jgi:glycosyltransferase involved in cell wall biosynthesis
MKLCAVLSHWIPKKIVCVAESAKLAHSQAGYDINRMVVIPNGFDVLKFTATQEQKAALRSACHFSDSDTVIGCVGRFHTDKGQDNFVKAAALIAQHSPTVKFLLVGRGCDIKNTQLMDWLNDSGLQEGFVLLGERDDVPVCLAAMDIFCMPSRTEGFPVGLGEAMVMGLACVATDVGDTAVLAGDTVVLVPPQNEQALAQGLLNVLALPEKQREDMGQRARERVMAEFSMEKAWKQFNAIYQNMLKNNN